MASNAVADHDKLSGKRVAVVGAGVSGLAAAYKLKSKGVNVTVFEADGRVGGKLRSVMHNGLIWDEGANTMTEAEPEVGSLLDDLGLREKQQFVSTFHGCLFHTERHKMLFYVGFICVSRPFLQHSL